MLVSIKNFSLYQYDVDKEMVFSLKTKRYLKWNKSNPTTKSWGLRVSLFNEKKISYIFKTRIEDILIFPWEQEIQKVEVTKKSTEIIEKTKKSTEKKHIETVQEKEMISFFKDRENKPLRRDSFIKKFGWNLFESRLLDETKKDGHKFYSLKN